MFIKIQPEGVDIKAVLPTQTRVFPIWPGKTQLVTIPFGGARLDESDVPVPVEITATTQEGNGIKEKIKEITPRNHGMNEEKSMPSLACFFVVIKQYHRKCILFLFYFF